MEVSGGVGSVTNDTIGETFDNIRHDRLGVAQHLLIPRMPRKACIFGVSVRRARQRKMSCFNMFDANNRELRRQTGAKAHQGAGSRRHLCCNDRSRGAAANRIFAEGRCCCRRGDIAASRTELTNTPAR
jgi:hypothetical protein